MRPIKFRAWDKRNKEMLQVDMLDFSTDEGLAHIGFVLKHGYGTAPLKTVDLMQFTGLLDKNGKEIYFGDILQTTNDDENDGCDFWDKDSYGYTVCQENPEELGVSFSDWYPTKDEGSITDLRYCEVIGNIYANPELVSQ